MRNQGQLTTKTMQLSEQAARYVARKTSRRGFLSRLGAVLVGGASLPLLPVARGSSIDEPVERRDYPGVSPQTSHSPEEKGDPTSCDYWRYCGIGGALCSCCGGGPAICPPGSEMSPIGWIGTCRNPVDGKNYIISYNDCCGQPTCTRCSCHRENPADRPIVRPQSAGSYHWCMGTKSAVFTCSAAVVVGLALDQE